MLEQQHPSGEDLVCEDKDCISVLRPAGKPHVFPLLLHIAEAALEAGCPARGGVLHRADYPRKPQDCPTPWREAFATPRSLCCTHCPPPSGGLGCNAGDPVPHPAALADLMGEQLPKTLCRRSVAGLSVTGGPVGGYARAGSRVNRVECLRIESPLELIL